MANLSKEEYEKLKVYCPNCHRLMIMGSVKNKDIKIGHLVVGGISYICLKCIVKNKRI